MSCLHTINGTPASGLFASCATLLQPGDAVLFIEDGTYYCSVPAALPKLQEGIELYVLREDMIARGTLDQKLDLVELASYSKFVELCCEFDKVISWF